MQKRGVLKTMVSRHFRGSSMPGDLRESHYYFEGLKPSRCN